MVNIGIVGIGYWGPNLVRNFNSIEGCSIKGICDISRERLNSISTTYRGIPCTCDMKELLSDPSIQAMVISTPASSHFDHARQCLKSGKHVFVEKPLALTVEECEELIALADKNKLCLMVGHTFLYNDAVIKTKELIRNKALGDVLYVYCQRLNLGKIRNDLDVVWNLAPHDISILCYWFDGLPLRVRAKGYSYIQREIADVAFMTLDFPGGIGAHVHVSWLDPNKTRLITIVGTKKMLVYDDISLDRKITIYDKGPVLVSKAGGDQTPIGYATYDDFKIELRDGDITIPCMKVREPLNHECKEFIRCVRSGSRPLADGKNGLDVVRVCRAGTLSMNKGGSPEDL